MLHHDCNEKKVPKMTPNVFGGNRLDFLYEKCANDNALLTQNAFHFHCARVFFNQHWHAKLMNKQTQREQQDI